MPPTNTEIQQCLSKLESKLNHLCSVVDTEFGTDQKKGRIYIFLEQHSKDMEEIKTDKEKLEHIVYGNGEQGLAGKLNVLWSIHEKKLKYLSEILVGVLIAVIGAMAAWYFS